MKVIGWLLSALILVMVSTGVATYLLITPPEQIAFPWNKGQSSELPEHQVCAITSQWVLDSGSRLDDLIGHKDIWEYIYNGHWEASYLGDGDWYVTSEFRWSSEYSHCSFGYYERTSTVNYLGFFEGKPSPQITVKPTPTVIPAYLLWTIIGICAVLFFLLSYLIGIRIGKAKQ